jgi:hypothetical protein
MPTQGTPRRQALAGAGTTGSLLVATIGGALVVAGLLGAGAMPAGPDSGSTAPLRVSSAPLRARADPAIVVPRVAAPRPLRRRASAHAPKRPHRGAEVAPSRAPSHGGGTTGAAVSQTPPSHGAPAPPSSGAAAAAPAPARGGPLAPAADVIGTATQAAAGAAQPAGQEVAGAVSGAGETAAGAVAQLGDAVGATLGDVGLR